MASDTPPIRVVGISGSLRAGSYNSAALRAAVALAPDGMTIETAAIGDLPLYNDDVRAAGYPAAVQRFRDQLSAADAILFVTPEYNYSIPGVLKNAIDWASRPPSQPFDNKPVAIMGASGGVLGTAGAIPAPADAGLPQRLPAQQAGGDDRRRSEQIRRGRHAHRRADEGVHPHPAGRPRELDGAAEAAFRIADEQPAGANLVRRPETTGVTPPWRPARRRSPPSRAGPSPPGCRRRRRHRSISAAGRP